jgi:hypothetical protein
MDSIEYKLSQIVKNHQRTINKTPSEIKEDKLKDLYDKLLAARDKYSSAPLSLEKAEKDYYNFKDGPNGYATQQVTKYTEEAKDLKQKKIEEHDKNINSVLESLAYYNSQRIYTTNVNIIKLTLLKEIIDKLKSIQNESANKSTNNRKTFYLLQEQEYLKLWIQFLNYCMIAFAIVYAIFCFKENKVSLFTFIFITVLLLIVFFLEWGIQLIRSIPLSYNVYTAWGIEEDKTTVMFWTIFSVSIGLFLIIYKTDKMINNFIKE